MQEGQGGEFGSGAVLLPLILALAQRSRSTDLLPLGRHRACADDGAASDGEG